MRAYIGSVSRYCFITGFLRSGTTLVEKLVHGLAGACIGGQPFPYLYYDVKRAFLEAYGGAGDRYPLGHLFGEDRYGPEDFEAFLERYRVSADRVAASFAAMRGYSGWKLPALADHADGIGEGSFAEVYRALCDVLPATLRADASDLLGAKEVFCEEFIPYFLTQGVFTVLVVRDIRDVITSLKLGSGGAYGSPDLPALHVVRQWRKSVAFALQFGGHDRFELVRYEELVAHPDPWLRHIASRLRCAPPAPDAIHELLDQDGRAWRGNSSFEGMVGVSRAPVGRFVEALPPSWVRAIEALCMPEMRALGLVPRSDPRSHGGELGDCLRRAAEDMHLVAPDQSLEDEVHAECERSRMLDRTDVDVGEVRRWFIFPRAYSRLAHREPVSS